MKLAFTFFHLFQYMFYGVLKLYYEYFNSKEFGYLNYTPLVIILFQSPTLLINLAILIIPKRLDSDIKKSLEELIRQSMNQKEELAVVGEKLSIMVKKNEKLLEKIFPVRIVQRLLDSKPIKPEKFDKATIFFSDIEGFTKICLHADPMDVFLLLNKLYTVMDYIANCFDVYKIETIGDAYVVGCGIGEEDNYEKSVDDFCVSVANFALVVREVVGLVEYHIPSMNLTSPVRLRIGMNSGPVIGGVVGTKMPRYCLFGSTINIASRMESTGVPERIQVSEVTARILQGTGFYIIEERGEIEVKNGGIIKTYWLLSASQKHPIINSDYISDIRNKAETLLLRKFSALRVKELLHGSIILGEMFEGDTSNESVEAMELHHSLLASVKKMSGSFLISSNNTSDNKLGVSSVNSSFSDPDTLAIVGDVIFRDDENSWDISYMDDLNDCLKEIEYSNFYSAIVIDLDCSDSIRADSVLFTKKLEEMQCRSLIIGLTNNYLEADAMKLELGISILVKPLDIKIFNKIFASYQLRSHSLHVKN